MIGIIKHLKDVKHSFGGEQASTSYAGLLESIPDLEKIVLKSYRPLSVISSSFDKLFDNNPPYCTILVFSVSDSI